MNGIDVSTIQASSATPAPALDFAAHEGRIGRLVRQVKALECLVDGVVRAESGLATIGGREAGAILSGIWDAAETARGLDDAWTATHNAQVRAERRPAVGVTPPATRKTTDEGGREGASAGASHGVLLDLENKVAHTGDEALKLSVLIDHYFGLGEIAANADGRFTINSAEAAMLYFQACDVRDAAAAAREGLEASWPQLRHGGAK